MTPPPRQIAIEYPKRRIKNLHGARTKNTQQGYAYSACEAVIALFLPNKTTNKQRSIPLSILVATD
jgi:hypothetical protein